jgi:hypothetical protein
LYGITDFEVQYWNGSSWTTVQNGKVANNNKVLTKIVFPALTTNRIRVVINSGQAGYSRLVEVEAWTTGTSNYITPSDSKEKGGKENSGILQQGLEWLAETPLW